MRRFLAAVLTACVLAQPAFAGGDICVIHEVGVAEALLVLTKPKLPKVRAAAPLVGFLDAKALLPLSGSLARGTTGSLVAGISFYQPSGVACFERVDIDDDFEGSGVVTCTDGFEEDVTWTPTSCNPV